MALHTELTLKLVATLSSQLDLAPAQVPLDSASRIRWSSGVGTDQADKMFTDRRTLAASATEDLDLSGSALPDGLGGTLVLARLKLLVVKASPANTNNVNITRPATNGVPLFLAAGGGMPIRPGGQFVWVAPDAVGVVVTAATGDLLTFTNSAGATPVTYDVIIIGASA